MYFDERQTLQWPNEKGQKDKEWSKNSTQKKISIEKYEQHYKTLTSLRHVRLN